MTARRRAEERAARGGLGRASRWRPSSRSCAVYSCAVPAPDRARRSRRRRAARATSRAASTGAARSSCGASRCPPPTASSTATSASTPTSTARRSRQAAVERLLEGGHRSTGRVADALLLALLETGVAITALDAAAVDGPVGLREARSGERLGSGELLPQLPPGRIVIADAERALGELFGRPHEDALPRKRRRRLVLVCVQVPGVPQIHVEEAALDLHRGAVAVGLSGAGSRVRRPPRGGRLPRRRSMQQLDAAAAQRTHRHVPAPSRMRRAQERAARRRCASRSRGSSASCRRRARRRSPTAGSTRPCRAPAARGC